MSIQPHQDMHIPIISPPGDTIRETMEIKGISMNKLAKVLYLDEREMTALLRGEIAIDPVLASRLATALNIPKSFWLNREAEYKKDLEENKTIT